MTNEILKDAQDIVLIRPSSDREKYVFAVAPSREVMRKYFDATLVNPAERSADGFNSYWRFNEETGEIEGSNLFLALRLDKVVRPEGLWIPGVSEVRVLEAKGKIRNGTYRDLGAVAYSDSSPNKNLAHSLITSSGRELPIMFSFRDLDYKVQENADFGVEVLTAEKPKSIVAGKEAQEMLAKVNFKANSGARRLDRNDDGDWGAYWSDLDYSDDAGRVGDWVCGEAARADLKTAQESLNERSYGIKIKELQAEQKKQAEEFARELGV